MLSICCACRELNVLTLAYYFHTGHVYAHQSIHLCDHVIVEATSVLIAYHCFHFVDVFINEVGKAYKGNTDLENRMEIIAFVVIVFVFIVLIVCYIFRRLFSCVWFCKSYDDKQGIFLESSTAINTNYNRCSCCTLGCICSPRHEKSIIYLPDSQQIHYGACAEEGNLENKLINKICPICYDNFKEEQDIVMLKCRHGYHGNCIRKWFRRGTHTTCPLCVQQINVDLLTFNDSGDYASQSVVHNVGGYYHFPVVMVT